MRGRSVKEWLSEALVNFEKTGLEFHHISDSITPSKLTSLDAMIEELKKCILYCADHVISISRISKKEREISLMLGCEELKYT